MNQAFQQFIFDLQRFADGDDSPATETAEATTEGGQAVEQPQPQEAFDGAKLRDMPPDDQVDYLSKHGFLGFPDEGEPEKADGSKGGAEAQGEDVQAATESERQTPAPDAQDAQEPEPEFEIVHNGEKVKVKQSELIQLAQQGYDYTRKTQQLAEQRRQYDALIAAAQVQQQTMRQPQQGAGQTPVQSAYDAAVAQAERALGIKAGEFNQFDPQHNFALQQAMMQQQQAQSERQHIAQQVQAFWQSVQGDPMAQEVNDKFELYMNKIGTVSQDGAKIARRVHEAYAHWLAQNPTMDDCQWLKAHWDYTRQELEKERQAREAQSQEKAKAKPAPPKTEPPGTGSSKETPRTLDKQQLQALSSDPDRQIAYLKRFGIFG